MLANGALWTEVSLAYKVTRAASQTVYCILGRVARQNDIIIVVDIIDERAHTVECKYEPHL